MLRAQRAPRRGCGLSGYPLERGRAPSVTPPEGRSGCSAAQSLRLPARPIAYIAASDDTVPQTMIAPMTQKTTCVRNAASSMGTAYRGFGYDEEVPRRGM